MLPHQIKFQVPLTSQPFFLVVLQAFLIFFFAVDVLRFLLIVVGAFQTVGPYPTHAPILEPYKSFAPVAALFNNDGAGFAWSRRIHVFNKLSLVHVYHSPVSQ